MQGIPASPLPCSCGQHGGEEEEPSDNFPHPVACRSAKGEAKLTLPAGNFYGMIPTI